jgi:hypothetical protein
MHKYVTAYDYYPMQERECIEYLMRQYHWCRDEAMEYFYYDPFNSEVWDNFKEPL